MTRKPDNGTLTKITEPYGGSTVEQRKAAMSRGLSAEEIAARNVIPTTAPDGKPHPGLHNPSGYIGFLGHTMPVRFRNIRIKEL